MTREELINLIMEASMSDMEKAVSGDKRAKFEYKARMAKAKVGKVVSGGFWGSVAGSALSALAPSRKVGTAMMGTGAAAGAVGGLRSFKKGYKTHHADSTRKAYDALKGRKARVKIRQRMN